jgi:tRNA dimethylallyltransferase
MLDKSLIVVCGPTAIGKTTLAIDLAMRFNTVILSADSRQFYREMSIGTAKPSAAELSAVTHHFINNLSIHDAYTAGMYEKEALALLDRLFLVHDRVILVGGSGLFIKAVCEGFDEFSPVDPESVNSKALAQLGHMSIEQMQEELSRLDPAYYEVVDRSNPRRLQRALEVIYTTGNKYSEQRTGQKAERPFNVIKIGLELPRDLLYDRINRRVDDMITAGLWQEASDLYTFRALQPLQTVGYQEVFDSIDGKLSQQLAIEKIKQNTRNYAKRQMTWFKKDTSIQWIDARDLSVVNKIQL